MRIAFDARYLNAGPGGVSTYVENLLKAMLRIDGDIEFLLITRKPGLSARFDSRRCRELVFNVEPRSLRTLYLLPLRLKRESVDVYHGTFNILPSHLDVPAAVTIHDLLNVQGPENIDPRPVYRCTAGLFWRVRIRHAARTADRIMTPSSATRQALLEAFPGLAPSKIIIAPYASDPEFAESPAGDTRDVVRKILGTESPYVLVVGNSSRHKNHQRAVEAFMKASRNGPDWKMIIVRRSVRRDRRIDRALSVPAVKKRIIVTGAVDKSTLRALYRHARVFFFPSWAEGFGLPILEAMASGCPVLTSNIGAMAEVASAAALTVSPDDVDGMAEALGRLMTDEILRTRLIEAGRENARKFSWAGSAGLTLDAYRQAVDRHRKRG